MDLQRPDFETVAEGLQFPEGPVAMADGSVLVVEIARRTLTRVQPGGGLQVIAELGGGPNGAAIGPDGAAYIANNGGAMRFVQRDGITLPGATPPGYGGGSIQRVDLATGAVATLYDSCDGRRLEGPNDLVFDRHGGFWFTEHGTTTPTGRHYGGLCYAAVDGSRIVRARRGLVSPNGVGLSPDEATVYVADSHLSRLWAFDLAAPGVLAEPPRFQPGRVVANLPGYQPLDSLAVEADGRICVATIFNGGITVFDPDGARAHHPFPDIFCTNICFGGADLRDAFITASGTGRLLKARWPRPGLRLAWNA